MTDPQREALAREHCPTTHPVQPWGCACGWGGRTGMQYAAHLMAEAREAATQRLAGAAFQVDSVHHFRVSIDDPYRPRCLCGFEGDARARTQTEHITAAVLEAFDHD